MQLNDANATLTKVKDFISNIVLTQHRRGIVEIKAAEGGVAGISGGGGGLGQAAAVFADQIRPPAGSASTDAGVDDGTGAPELEDVVDDDQLLGGGLHALDALGVEVLEQELFLDLAAAQKILRLVRVEDDGGHGLGVRLGQNQPRRDRLGQAHQVGLIEPDGKEINAKKNSRLLKNEIDMGGGD